jgi:hypothetical protein
MKFKRDSGRAPRGPKVRVRGSAMAYYRLYLLDEKSRKIIGFEEIDAENDEAAVAWAKSRQPAIAMELWCSKRKIRDIEISAGGQCID